MSMCASMRERTLVCLGYRAVARETAKEARARGAECLTLAGVLVTILGLLIALPLHDAVADQIRAGVLAFTVMDTTASGAYAGWVDSRDPSAGQVVSSYWFFNVTNPDEVMMGARPVLEEVGPVRYLYTNTKHNVSWEAGGTEVLWREYQYYTPLDDATRALQDTLITTLNIVQLGALNMPSATIDDLLPLLDFEPTASLFARRSMHDLLFGYTDNTTLKVPLIGTPINFPYPGIQPNDTSLEYALSQHSVHRMHSGKGDAHRANEYLQWNGGTDLLCCSGNLPLAGTDGLIALPAGNIGGEADAPMPCSPLWNTYDSAPIKGVFGTAFHPFIDPSEQLHLATYPFGILRSWPLECANVGHGRGPGRYNDGSSLTSGIGGCDDYSIQGVEMLKFALPTWVMGNVSVDAGEAAGYNITGPSGILGTTAPCDTFAPIVLSRPHYLHGSNSLRDAFDGMSAPVESIHDSWLGVEPLTGKVMDFQFRVQINAAVGPLTIKGLVTQWTYFPLVTPHPAFPIAWGEQYSTVTPAQGVQFQGQVYTPLIVAAAFRWGGVTLTVLAFVCAILWSLRARALRADVLSERGGGGALEKLLAGEEEEDGRLN